MADEWLNLFADVLVTVRMASLFCIETVLFNDFLMNSIYDEVCAGEKSYSVWRFSCHYIGPQPQSASGGKLFINSAEKIWEHKMHN